MTRRLSNRLTAQDGFGIIEVLVSAILVVMASTGVFLAFDAATNASGTNKSRSVAANVARGDQERLRSLSAEDLAALSPSRTEVVNGKTYTVASSTEWVADRTGTPTCSSADGRADYLKLRSSVTWPKMGGLKPVVMESLRAIPRGAFRPNQGSISVKVTDRNGVGVPGATVAISGPANYSGTTNALGCVLIDQVPVGSYTATMSKAGYVTDTTPNNPSVVESLSVAKEQTSTVTTTLDQAGTARVIFRTTTAVCTSSCTAANTTGDSFTIANAGLGSPTTRSFSLAPAVPAVATLFSGAGTAADTTGATRSLFPFSSAYTVWAGTCNEANPATYTQPQVQQIIAPGALTPATPTLPVYVRRPLMALRIERNNGTDNLAQSRVVIKPVVSGCTRTPAPVQNTATTLSRHLVNVALPYGDYSVCAMEGTGSGTSNRRRSITTVQNRVAGGTTTTIRLPTSASNGSCPN
ncbi:MAG: carboxypeptidase regulatory-like domain-containing protein [Mycobacterium sp.]